LPNEPRCTTSITAKALIELNNKIDRISLKFINFIIANLYRDSQL